MLQIGWGLTQVVEHVAQFGPFAQHTPGSNWTTFGQVTSVPISNHPLPLHSSHFPLLIDD